MLVLATTRRPHRGQRRRPDPDVRGDRTSATSPVTAAPDYRTRSRVVGDTTVRVYYRPGAPGAAMLDAAADAFDAAASARLGPTRTRLQGRPVGRRLRDGVAGPDLDPDRGRRVEPALPGRPRDRPPVVLRDRRQRPGARTVRRRGRRRLRGALRAGPAPRQPLRDGDASTADLRLLGARATTRIYIQGGNLLDDARRRMGSTAFWAALRGYIAANRNGFVDDRALLEALDAATPIDLGGDAVRPEVPADLLSGRGGDRCRVAPPRCADPRRAPSASGGTRRAGPAARRASQPRATRSPAARGRPTRSPYSSRTDGGSRPTDGHSVQAYAAGGDSRRSARQQRRERRPQHDPRQLAGDRRDADRAVRAEHLGEYASNASRSAGSRPSGTPNARPIGRVSS